LCFPESQALVGRGIGQPTALTDSLSATYVRIIAREMIVTEGRYTLGHAVA
jgi:hypothetical protein